MAVAQAVPSKWSARVDRYEKHGRHGKPYADPTESSMAHIRKSFCSDAEFGEPEQALQNVSPAQLKAFFDWLIEHPARKTPQVLTLLQYLRVFEMIYKQATGAALDKEHVWDVKDFIRFHAEGKAETSHRPKPVPSGTDVVRIFATHTPTATGFDALPSCGQTCINNMKAQYSTLGCSSPDPPCLCKNPNFQYGIRDCVNGACGTAVASTVISYGSSYCASATATTTAKA